MKIWIMIFTGILSVTSFILSNVILTVNGDKLDAIYFLISAIYFYIQTDSMDRDIKNDED